MLITFPKILAKLSLFPSEFCILCPQSHALPSRGHLLLNLQISTLNSLVLILPSPRFSNLDSPFSRLGAYLPRTRSRDPFKSSHSPAYKRTRRPPEAVEYYSSRIYRLTPSVHPTTNSASPVCQPLVSKQVRPSTYLTIATRPSPPNESSGHVTLRSRFTQNTPPQQEMPRKKSLL